MAGTGIHLREAGSPQNPQRAPAEEGAVVEKPAARRVQTAQRTHVSLECPRPSPRPAHASGQPQMRGLVQSCRQQLPASRNRNDEEAVVAHSEKPWREVPGLAAAALRTEKAPAARTVDRTFHRTGKPPPTDASRRHVALEQPARPVRGLLGIWQSPAGVGTDAAAVRDCDTSYCWRSPRNGPPAGTTFPPRTSPSHCRRRWRCSSLATEFLLEEGRRCCPGQRSCTAVVSLGGFFSQALP